MDSFQEEVTRLNTKVDALHEIIEQLKSQTTEILSEVKIASDKNPVTSSIPSRPSYLSRSSFSIAMEHKDVLSDDNYPDSDTQNGDRVLTPEIQIQRLTAQLTAAYNRIAALEEQLLAKRSH
ncbi:hypothetical protein IFO70_15045 [Phormidium tenue FACHB-886]|nr:hypothetical protein [Phormidium tenue FACHB-886]